MKKILLAIAVAAIPFMNVSASAHPGNTDKFGCHTNKKIGYYHCHKPKEEKFTRQELLKQNEPTPFDVFKLTVPKEEKFDTNSLFTKSKESK